MIKWYGGAKNLFSKYVAPLLYLMYTYLNQPSYFFKLVIPQGKLKFEKKLISRTIFFGTFPLLDLVLLCYKYLINLLKMCFPQNTFFRFLKDIEYWKI